MYAGRWRWGSHVEAASMMLQTLVDGKYDEQFEMSGRSLGE